MTNILLLKTHLCLSSFQPLHACTHYRLWSLMNVDALHPYITCIHTYIHKTSSTLNFFDMYLSCLRPRSVFSDRPWPLNHVSTKGTLRDLNNFSKKLWMPKSVSKDRPWSFICSFICPCPYIHT